MNNQRPTSVQSINAQKQVVRARLNTTSSNRASKISTVSQSAETLCTQDAAGAAKPSASLFESRCQYVATRFVLHDAKQPCDEGCAKLTPEQLNTLYQAFTNDSPYEKEKDVVKFEILHEYLTCEDQDHYIAKKNKPPLARENLEKWRYCFVHGGLPLLRGCPPIEQKSAITRENMLYMFSSLVKDPYCSQNRFVKELKHSTHTIQRFMSNCGFVFTYDHPVNDFLPSGRGYWILTEPKPSATPLTSATPSTLNAHLPSTSAFEKGRGKKSEKAMPTMTSLYAPCLSEQEFEDDIDSFFSSSGFATEMPARSVQVIEELFPDLLTEDPDFSFNHSATTLHSPVFGSSEQVQEAAIALAKEEFWQQFGSTMHHLDLMKALIQCATTHWEVKRKSQVSLKTGESDFADRHTSASMQLFQLKMKWHALTLKTDIVKLLDLHQKYKNEKGNEQDVSALAKAMDKIIVGICSLFRETLKNTLTEFVMLQQVAQEMSAFSLTAQNKELLRVHGNIRAYRTKRIAKFQAYSPEFAHTSETVYELMEKLAQRTGYELKDRYGNIYAGLLTDIHHISEQDSQALTMLILMIKHDFSLVDVPILEVDRGTTLPSDYYVQKFYAAHTKFRSNYTKMLLYLCNSRQSAHKKADLNTYLYNLGLAAVECCQYWEIIGTLEELRAPKGFNQGKLKKATNAAIKEQARNITMLKENAAKLAKAMSLAHVKTRQLLAYLRKYLRKTDYLVFCKAISARKYAQFRFEPRKEQATIHESAARDRVIESKNFYTEAAQAQSSVFQASLTNKSINLLSFKHEQSAKRSSSQTLSFAPAKRVKF